MIPIRRLRVPRLSHQDYTAIAMIYLTIGRWGGLLRKAAGKIGENVALRSKSARLSEIFTLPNSRN